MADPQHPRQLQRGVQAPDSRALQRRQAGFGDHVRVRLGSVHGKALDYQDQRDWIQQGGRQQDARAAAAPGAREGEQAPADGGGR